MANKVPKFTVSHHKQVRNAFDLSQSHVFQAAPGQLLPILSLELIPDDDVTINLADFVKSMPIVNAPFCNARGVYEFFFVPFHQLWHNYDQFITQMNDYRSSYFVQSEPPSSIPSYGTFSHGGKSYIRLSPRTLATLPYENGEISKKDLFGYDTLPSLSYLYDLLGYCPFGSSVNGKFTPNTSAPNYAPNLFRLAAYQKIYQDYYRKTSYETFDVMSYSLDNLQTYQISSLTEIRYRNYGLDLLNNLRPSAVLNVNNKHVFNNIIPRMFGTDVISVKQPDKPSNSFTSSYFGPVSNDPSSTNSTMFGLVGSPLSGISVQSIRAAFALDKLSQIIGRAEKDFKSQMSAVFGVNVTEGRDGKCIFIDGISSDISFGEVDNTNGDSFGSKFSSYGKVTGGSNGQIHFKSPEFGLLMCIYSIIPFVPYDSTYVDRFNTKHVYSDYFNPLYQRLGLQPLYQYQLDCTGNPDEVGELMANALGWQPRYSEYKTAVDRNHGQFNLGQSLQSFTASRSRALHSYLHDLVLKDFKINPNCFDSVFTVNFDGSLNSYPFMVKTSFNCVKVSAMDTDSLPLI